MSTASAPIPPIASPETSTPNGPSVEKRAISGGVVTAAAQAVRFGLYMLSTVVLARLLQPEDFGLVAMVGALISFMRIFRDGGLSMATIQRQQLTQHQVSNMFWLNVALGLTAAAACVALSPAVAWFYKDQRLVLVTVALAASFVISGASVQHLAMLNRQLRFKALAVIDISAMVASLAVGVVMALTGFGYWSLVGSQLALPVIEAILAVSLSGWRPAWFRRGEGTRSMITFGASLSTASLLRTIAGASDTLLLGRFFGADAVGLYSRAMALLKRPLDQFILPFDIVMVPALARIQHDETRYRSVFLKVYQGLAFVSFPLAAVLFGLSRPLVMALLGPEWYEVVPIFAALSLAAVYIPMGYAAMWLLTTQGRSKDILVTGIAFSTISIISVAAGLGFGALGVAIAYSTFGLFVRLPVQYFVIGRKGAVTTGDLWRAFAAQTPVWMAITGAVYGASTWLQTEAVAWQIAAGVIAGAVTFGLIAFLVPSQRRTALGLLEIVREFRPSAKARNGA